MSDPRDRGKQPLRLTKDVREALMRVNEGFSDSTHYSGKNFTETRRYTIADGQLRVNAHSKTSWADSRREDDFVADEGATHRFLRERLHRLDTDGVSEAAAAIKAARTAADPTEDTATDTTERAPTPDAPEDPDAGNEYMYMPDDDRADDEVSWADVRVNFVALAAISALAWVAPHAEKAWKTTAKPKLQEWRARRLARAMPQDTDSAQVTQPGESPDAENSGDDLH